MKIWLVCQDVDLGYHVISAHSTEASCQLAFDLLVKKHVDAGYTWGHGYFRESWDLNE